MTHRIERAVRRGRPEHPDKNARSKRKRKRSTVTLFGRSIRAALCLSLIFGLCPLYAHAYRGPEIANDSAENERGIVYVGYDFGEGVKSETISASAPDETLETYSTRVGFGAKDLITIHDCTVNANGKDITADCIYHEDTGYLSIPIRYAEQAIHIGVRVSEQSRQAALSPQAYIALSGSDIREALSSVKVTDDTPSIHIAVSGDVVGISQDTGVLSSNEWFQTATELVLPARCALSGSVVVHMEDNTNKSVIPFNHVESALNSSNADEPSLIQEVGVQKAYALGGFSGSGTLISTNPGPTNDDYTDYILTWDGNSANLGCCEHGIIHIPSVASGVTASFTASVASSSERKWDEQTPTEIIHYTETTETYEIYVDGGQFGTYTIQNGNTSTQHGYQSVRGAWTGEPEVSEWREPRYGKVDIHKRSSNTDITDANGCYALAGARYGIYSNASCTDLQSTITTDSGGYALSGDLKVNRYYIKEISAPKGYALDANVYPVDIVADTIVHVNNGSVSDIPQSNAASIWVAKLDLETSKGKPQGGASLAGAEFRIRYFAGYYSSAAEAERSGTLKRTWVVRSNENGQVPLEDAWKVSGDKFYKDSTGKTTIPLGTVLIQEIKAPTGYLLSDSNVYIRQITAQGSAENVNTFNAPAIKDQIKRGDLEFVKAKATDQSRLGGVPFRITSTTTGESHILVTDANGEAKTASSWNPHSSKTNANDAAISANGTIDESKLNPSAGIWFGSTSPDNSKGALPYDTYQLEELRCSSNEGTKLVSIAIVVSQDAYTINIGTIEDQPQAAVTITTEAFDKRNGSKQTASDPETKIVDRVEYRNIEPEKPYVLIATVMDRASKQPLQNSSGDPITAKKEFTPTSTNGVESVDIVFDSTVAAGHDIVIFEKLEDKSNGDVLAVHEDIEDYSQTVKVLEPSIKTSATDLTGSGKKVATDPEAQFKDSISFRNLIDGLEYTVIGTLMQRGTNEAEDASGVIPLTNEKGEPYTATTTFIPENKDGTIDIAFECDTTELAGKQIVIYEEVRRLDKTIAEHKDAGDAAQTLDVSPVDIRTQARDALDGDKDVSAAPGECIIDVLHYENTIPGKEYKAKGSLHTRTLETDTDGNTSYSSAPLLNSDGTAITVEAYFIPESTVGDIEIKFPFDATHLADKELVLFEELYRNNILITEHVDAADDSQSVRIVPIEISTTAIDAKDEDSIVAAESSSKISDTVRFSGLTPGKEYLMSGTLMVRTSNPDNPTEDISAIPMTDSQNHPFTAQKHFVPDDGKGTVSLEFDADTTLFAGKDIVVFEKLYLGDTEIAQHEDILDTSQTLSIKTISIATVLLEKGTEEKSLNADSEAKLIDTIKFRNALVDKEYDIFAMLINTDTGLPVLQRTDANQNQDNSERFFNELAAALGTERQGEVTYPLQPDMEAVKHVLESHMDIANNIVTYNGSFIPDSGGGTTEITYRFDARGLENTSATSCVLIADHESGTILTGETDLANEAQTVSIVGCRISTYATDLTDGNKELFNSENARINDEVSYTGLTAGKEYTVRGVLYDKETEKPLLVEDEKVTATKDFVPAASDGSIDVQFEFDATNLDGHELVVFEELFRDMETTEGLAENILVADDGDINNAAQTVSISGSAKPTKEVGSSNLAKTGDPLPRYLKAFAMLGIISLGALGVGTLLSKRKRKNSSNL